MTGRLRPLLAALLFSLALPAHAELEDISGLRGQVVEDVKFSGDSLPEGMKLKFLKLKDQDFSPGVLRSLILWFHENNGDAFLQVNADRNRRGLVLHVAAKRRLKVGEILFEGNGTASTSVLQQQIELKPGFDYDAEVAKSAAQKISLFYSKQGYLASEVKYQFDPQTHALKFVVREGEPTLLSSVSISPMTNVELPALRNRYESDILEAFGLRAGDRIQRDKVLEGIQAVKDWLRDHDFLMARDPNLEYKVGEDGRVGLSLDISYGARIRYGFRGNIQFSYRELTLLVSDVKEVSSGADYLSAVRRRVLEAYKEIGFANAKITTLVREDPQRGIRYVSLIVNEGQKILIDKIEIEGVFSISKEEAREQFQKLGTRLVQRDFFDEAGINRAADLFAEKLRSEGYLSARLEYVKLDYNPEHTKVSVSLLFSEGVQTKVQSVEIVGVKNLSETEVREMFGLREGQPFNIFAFEKGLLTLKDRYQEIGNLSAQIVNEGSESLVKYSKDNSQVFIRVEVDEGPTFKVGEIIVIGNQFTHARVILRELPFISGDILTSSLLNEAEEYLRKLNLFGNVTVRHIDHPSADDLKDILITVEETEPGSFDIVPGFRNDLGARLGFELGYNNLGGWNRSVSAGAVFNRRLQNYYDRRHLDGTEDLAWKQPEYRFSLGFREPYLANWPVVFTSNLIFLRRQYSKFDASVQRFTMGIKRELSRYLSGFLEYGYERVAISSVRLPYLKESDERTDNIGTVTPGFIVDSRADIFSRYDPFKPVKGFYSVNRFEVAAKAFGSGADVAYYRTSTSNSAYFRIWENIVFAVAVNLGWERSNEPNKPIPPLKLFRLGGLGSIRGYNEDGIEKETTRVYGALGTANYRGELRIPIQGDFGTAFFLDAGNLMVDRWSFAPEKMRSSVGTGLRYNTPVGPVLLDFAWRLQSDPEVGDTCVTTVSATTRSCEKQATDRYKIHFAIGVF